MVDYGFQAVARSVAFSYGYNIGMRTLKSPECVFEFYESYELGKKVSELENEFCSAFESDNLDRIVNASGGLSELYRENFMNLDFENADLVKGIICKSGILRKSSDADCRIWLRDRGPGYIRDVVRKVFEKIDVEEFSLN